MQSLLRRARWTTRWSLALAAAACILLCAASRWWMIAVDAYWLGTCSNFLVRYGRIEYWGTTPPQRLPIGWPGARPPPRNTVLLSRQPITEPALWWTMRPRWTGQPWHLIVPLWWLTAAAGLGATGLWRLERRWMRRGGSFCPRCDYDLIGLEEGRPCPECGLERTKKTGQ